MTTDSTKSIVVGVDGSAAAAAAAAWAADEAVRRGSSLDLIEAYLIPVGYAGPGGLIPPGLYQAAAAAAEEDLAATTATIHSRHPDLEITRTACMDTPFSALSAAGKHAELLVVGSHGMGLAGETILGSVAQKLISHSVAPVVVIRSDPHDPVVATPAPSAPVLVGLDSSPGSDSALMFALQEAGLRGVDLVAVRCWDDEPLNGFLRAYPLEVDRNRIDGQERSALDDQLAVGTEKFPLVNIRPVVRRGRASSALLAECDVEKPCALVVGSRGRGGFAGLVLGSTGHEAVAYASCPVVVIHPPHH